MTSANASRLGEPQAGQRESRACRRLLVVAVPAGLGVVDDRRVEAIAHVLEIALERRERDLELVEENVARDDAALVQQLVDPVEALRSIHAQCALSPSAYSRSQHSVLTSSICSGLLHRMFSRSGLATTTARHFARDTATFSRFLSYRNSMFRGR